MSNQPAVPSRYVTTWALLKEHGVTEEMLEAAIAEAQAEAELVFPRKAGEDEVMTEMRKKMLDRVLERNLKKNPTINAALAKVRCASDPTPAAAPKKAKDPEQALSKLQNTEGSQSTDPPLKTIKMEEDPEPAKKLDEDSDFDEVREIREVEILPLLSTQRFLRFDVQEWDEREVEQFIKLFLINPDYKSLVLKMRELRLNGAALHYICEGEAEELGLDENDRFVLIQQLDEIERIVTENKMNIPPLFD